MRASPGRRLRLFVCGHRLTEAGGKRRAELLFDAVYVAEHPKFGDLDTAGCEERRSGPRDGAAGRLDAEEAPAMDSREAHPRGGSIFGRDKVVDAAGVAGQRRVDR